LHGADGNRTGRRVGEKGVEERIALLFRSRAKRGTTVVTKSFGLARI
jgi:hypothetical protein